MIDALRMGVLTTWIDTLSAMMVVIFLPNNTILRVILT